MSKDDRRYNGDWRYGVATIAMVAWMSYHLVLMSINLNVTDIKMSLMVAKSGRVSHTAELTDGD